MNVLGNNIAVENISVEDIVLTQYMMCFKEITDNYLKKDLSEDNFLNNLLENFILIVESLESVSKIIINKFLYEKDQDTYYMDEDDLDDIFDNINDFINKEILKPYSALLKSNGIFWTSTEAVETFIELRKICIEKTFEDCDDNDSDLDIAKILDKLINKYKTKGKLKACQGDESNLKHDSLALNLRDTVFTKIYNFIINYNEEIMLFLNDSLKEDLGIANVDIIKKSFENEKKLADILNRYDNLNWNSSSKKNKLALDVINSLTSLSYSEEFRNVAVGIFSLEDDSLNYAFKCWKCFNLNIESQIREVVNRLPEYREREEALIDNDGNAIFAFEVEEVCKNWRWNKSVLLENIKLYQNTYEQYQEYAKKFELIENQSFKKIFKQLESKVQKEKEILEKCNQFTKNYDFDRNDRKEAAKKMYDDEIDSKMNILFKRNNVGKFLNTRNAREIAYTEIKSYNKNEQFISVIGGSIVEGPDSLSSGMKGLQIFITDQRIFFVNHSKENILEELEIKNISEYNFKKGFIGGKIHILLNNGTNIIIEDINNKSIDKLTLAIK